MEKKKKLGLTGAIFVALILGALTGVVLHYFVPSGYVRDTVFVGGIFEICGEGFLRLMKMLVVPLVGCSIVCGSAAVGDMNRLGKIGVKTIIFYLLTTSLAVSVALAIGNLLNPGMGLDISTLQTAEVAETEAVSLVDTLLDIIPTNPIQSLAEGSMLQIIVFALIVGIILAKLGERAKLVHEFFIQFNNIMMEMTLIVMKLAPIGVFCLVAKTFTNIGFGVFINLLKYMVCVELALVIQVVVVYMLMLKLFTGANPFKFFKKFLPVMGFAFSTATSNATIPMSIDTLENKLGVTREVSAFTIPLGATINMDGTSIMQGVAVVFAAQAFGIPLGVKEYVMVILTATLASIGTAGVPSVGLVTLAMVFSSVGLPTEAIGIIMGVDRILDMSRTATNIAGDAVCTTIIAHQEGGFDKAVFNDATI